MKYLAVDDDKADLTTLVDAISSSDPTCEIVWFDDPVQALEMAKQTTFDAVFLDIRMKGLDGLALARELVIINPRLNIIFATGHPDYALDAFGLNASDYILKPVSSAKIQKSLANLRFCSPIATQHKVYFRCFGNFEIFVDGKPLKFKYEKSKEMLAFLFDRQGSVCTTSQVYNTLWEDEGHFSYYKQVRRSLLAILAEHGLSELIHSRRGRLGINMSMIESDYIDWQAGKPEAVNAYHGEYMSQYSWAEYTNGAMFNQTLL